MAHKTVLAFVVIALACFASAEVLASGGCENAQYVPGPYTGQVVVGDTSNAATFSNTCGLSTSSGTYFYLIQPTANAPMNVTTCHADTTFDTVLAIYQGDDCDDLQCVASNDDTTCDSTVNASSIQFTPNGGTYWVMVSGYSTAEGQFEISFKQGSPTENGCTQAATLHGPFDPPVTVYGSLSGNTTSAAQPCGLYSTQLGNWYLIYPSPGARVTVTTCSDFYGFDTIVAVLSGESCDDLECVGYSDDNCSIYSALSTYDFVANDPFYYVYVTGYSSNWGNYYLTISEVSATPPPQGSGDTCSDAIALPGPGMYPGFSNQFGQTLGTLCSVSSFNGCAGAWFVIDAPHGTNVEVSTCTSNTDFDTVMAAISDCNNSSICLDENDDGSCNVASLTSTVSFVAPSEPVYVVVSGYNCARGNFGLVVTYE